MKRSYKQLLSIVTIMTMFLFGCNNINAISKNNKSMDKKLKLIFTLDTEDKYGHVPNLIECDFGDAGNVGVNYIMDTFEKYDMKGVFFVNIYEHVLYDEKDKDYMKNLLKRISDRGHEVGLHAHKETSFDFYQREIYDLSYDDQVKMLEYGAKFIEDSIGKKPISYRSGGYYCNDDTFKALEKTGFLYDSSYYYGQSGNKFKTYNSLNQVTKIGGLTEFPVIRTIRSDGELSKLDFNNMSYEDIISVIEQMKQRDDFPIAQMMFHSFSFMDQKVQDGVMPYFQEGTHPAYGPSKSLMSKFEKVLQYIKDDPDIEVITFEDYSKMKQEEPSMDGDGIFYVDTEKGRKAAEEFVFNPENEKYRLADLNANLNAVKDVIWFTPQDVDVEQNGMTFNFTNNYDVGDVNYAWYIMDCNLKQDIYKGNYTENNTFSYTFDKSGKYQIKAFVKNSDNSKGSKIIADIIVDAENSTCKIIVSNPS